MTLVLIGYRGTGKRTVGTVLARTRGRTVGSPDAGIQKRATLPVP